MIQPSRLSSAVLVACAAAACGDTTSTSGGGATPVTSAQQFEVAFADALCDHLFRCPISDDDTLYLRTVIGTRAACARFASSVVEPWSYLRPALAAGTVRYDAAAGMRCIARLRGMCRTDGLDVEALAQQCPDVFVGSVAAGGTCHTSFECVPSAYCQRAESATGPSTCPGTCRPRIAAGATCDFDGRRCARPADGWAECRANGDTMPTCRAVTVGAPAGESQPCGYIPVAGRDAVTMVPCQQGLWCTSRVQAGTCRRPLAVGAPCLDDDDVCAGDALCASAGMGMPRTCMVIPMRTRVGETCGATVLALCNPTARLRCSSNNGGTCVSTGTGAAGSTCARGDLSFFSCDPGLVCRTNAGGAPTCQRPGAVGEACDNDGDCASGSCDNVANRCAARACE